MEYGDRFVDSIGIFYYPSENLFRGEDGEVIYAIHDLVPPLILDLFLEEGKYMTHEIDALHVIELFYPDEGGDDLYYEEYLYAMGKYDAFDHVGPHINALR